MIRIIGFTIHNGHTHGFTEIEPPIVAFSLKEAIDFQDSITWEYVVNYCLKHNKKTGFRDPVSTHITYVDSDSILKRTNK